MAVSDWSTVPANNTHLNGFSLSGPYGRIFAELMAESKEGFDNVESDITETAESLTTKLDPSAVIPEGHIGVPVAGTLAVANGGTGGATAAAARENLGAVDSEDVSSTFAWEAGETPAHFFACRIGKTVHIFYQGAQKTHDYNDVIGTTTLNVTSEQFVPFIKNDEAYGVVSFNAVDGGGTQIQVKFISSRETNTRIYFNGTILIQ